MQGAPFRLIMRRGPQPNQQFELNRDTLTIGRDITNDVVINDPEVSRHHARLTRTGGGFMMEDLRSTNGTFINRQRISSPTQMNSGDIVGLGETVTLVYEGGAGPVETVIGGASGGAQQQPGGYAPSPAPSYSAPAAPAPSAPPATSSATIEGDEEGVDVNRLVVVGCAVLTVAFCCTLVAALWYIDANYLWCDVPVLNSVLDCAIP